MYVVSCALCRRIDKGTRNTLCVKNVIQSYVMKVIQPHVDEKKEKK